jgi:hypothetical protein
MMGWISASWEGAHRNSAASGVADSQVHTVNMGALTGSKEYGRLLAAALSPRQPTVNSNIGMRG